MSCLACSSETPALSLATTVRYRPLLYPSARVSASGVQTSALLFGKEKPCGITPITSHGTPSTCTFCPTIAASPQNRKEFRRDLHSLYSKGLVVRAEICHQSRNRRHRLERLRLLPPVHKIEGIHHVSRRVKAGGRLPDAHEPARLRVRQRSQKNRVNDTEDCRVRSDS